MDVAKGIGVVLLFILTVAFLAIIGAYPVMWAVNYLINPDFLGRVFTTTHFGFWDAFALNWLAGALIKGTSYSSSSK
jgi:hypothetical protein